MSTSKSHYVTVCVRFDRPITRSQARNEFKNNIYGEHFCGEFSDAAAFKIGRTLLTALDADGKPLKR